MVSIDANPFESHTTIGTCFEHGLAVRLAPSMDRAYGDDDRAYGNDGNPGGHLIHESGGALCDSVHFVDFHGRPLPASTARLWYSISQGIQWITQQLWAPA